MFPQLAYFFLVKFNFSPHLNNVNNTERCECERKMCLHCSFTSELHVLTLYFYADIYIYKYIKHTQTYMWGFLLIDFGRVFFLRKLDHTIHAILVGFFFVPNNIPWTFFLHYRYIYCTISVAVESIFGCIIIY